MKLSIVGASISFPCSCLLTRAECVKGLFPADKVNSISLYFNSISLSRIANHSARKNYYSYISPLKGQCPDYAHARASSVFSSKDNRTVKLTRQDFLPDRTADREMLFIFSSNILDFRRSLSSYIKIWLAVRRLIAILSLAGPPRDPKISFRSL